MWPVGVAILYALFVWWFSTGLILILVRMRREWHGLATIGLSVVTVMSLIGLAATREDTTPVGAFAGFTYAIVVWAWLEATFLYGFITGPRKIGCPPGARGLERLKAAWSAVSYHEFAILIGGLLLAAVSYGADNQTGVWTFLVLWAMRISAKLNVYYGAPNVAEEFFAWASCLPGQLLPPWSCECFLPGVCDACEPRVRHPRVPGHDDPGSAPCHGVDAGGDPAWIGHCRTLVPRPTDPRCRAVALGAEVRRDRPSQKTG